MSKILVMSYSRSGTTLAIAGQIAKRLGADIGEIADPTPRAGVLSYLQAGFESLARGLPAIIIDCNPAEYDFVVVGTPVWFGSMCSPMRTFLFAHAQQMHNVACFCTMGARGGEKTLREMKALLGDSHAPTLAMSEADLRNGRGESKICEFVAVVGARARSTEFSAVS